MGLGRLVPVISAPVWAIVLGASASAFFDVSALSVGAGFAGKNILQAAVVILGVGLSPQVLWRVGLGSLPVMLSTMAAGLTMAWLVGRWLGLKPHLTTMIGVGTAICGASAIAAVSPVIDAEDGDLAFAIGTIFLFNVVAVLLYPTLGHLMDMTAHGFGLFAGTAINDTSSVMAAAYSFGGAAGAYAIVVKLTRTLWIVPITLVLGLTRGRSAGSTAAKRARLPLFVVLFVLAALLGAVLPAVGKLGPQANVAALFLITWALAGVGLGAPIKSVRHTGARPLVLGAVLWATVGLVSLLWQGLL